jgi:probable rRNA maturation factor
VRNRQHVRRADLRILRRIVQALLRETCPNRNFDLAIYIVAEPEMTRLNETFLHHQGSTDVITFDYAEPVSQASCLFNSNARMRRAAGNRYICDTLLHGEIFVCVDEAIIQARRFRMTWQSELVRYIVHGVLHLLGYDDLNSRVRRKMKESENALLRHLASQFEFRSLDRALVAGSQMPPTRAFT